MPTVYVNERLCKGCGICKEFCAQGVFDFGDRLNERGAFPVYVRSQDSCTGCRLCEVFCPDYALCVED